MGIFDVIKKSILGVSFESKLMKTITTPIFIKEFNKESKNILNFKELLNNSTDQVAKNRIDNELNLQKYVQEGLSKVYFELKNSPAPFYALHNIRLGLGDGIADIDFLMITHQFCYIIKCKSLQGNIEIDSQGDFSRFVKKAEIVLKKILKVYSLDKLPVVSLTVFTNPKATDKQEFIAIKGFGEVKFEKYGEDIINIIKRFTCRGENYAT
ncbi:NERD domain-containing protein [Clostridium sp. CM028]|uniref:NERD domain-containing protein n=1 Tax=Clostridium sp. CM028 TaxID=2851575 RepID=UPI001C6E2707|nr:NERD domain-containing protein [Clostridium sp. CM028]MBW9150491.1 NERD domain-containing protein [Clostridium sp. CM028]WLC62835.1 NERD domain-containing protein [Clostridium sp. CM028]